MSWLFSRVLVEAFWGGTSSDGEQCAQLNVMPTAHLFWHRDKPMDASRFSRFGLTSRPLTADRGEDLLMWFREDFLVRTSPLQEAETDSMESAPDSGERWLASFATWNHDTSTWRTAQRSLLGGLEEFLETWPNSGSMRNGECWERPTLELHTSESESGLWQTPVADDAANRKVGKWNSRGEPKLSAQAMLYPTPTEVDTGSRFNRSASGGAALRPTPEAMAKFDLWATPTATLGTNGGGKGGLLNPDWVEWLMGWPIGWTALQPLGMDKFLEWQQQHGADFGEENEK
jgi:hypothetical protein